MTDPFMLQLLYRAVVAGLPVVVMCGVLSVLVVVKRLGFVGQGVSHSAFGGVGVATVLAVYLPVSLLPYADAIQFAVIVVFCIAAGLGIAAVSHRRQVSEDTAIGLFLVGSMALGAILVHASYALAAGRGRAPTAQPWESILFGSVMLTTPREAGTAWVVATIVLATVWWVRRPLLFWVFDEESAPAFGVPGAAMRTTLMVLLSIAIVVAMKLVGVVLATALLVLPGAAALRLTDRLWPSIAISVVASVTGLLGGLWLSVGLDWPPGPCVVGVLTALFAGAAAVRGVSGARDKAGRRAEGLPAPVVGATTRGGT